jgi:hypothetical protein
MRRFVTANGIHILSMVLARREKDDWIAQLIEGFGFALACDFLKELG